MYKKLKTIIQRVKAYVFRLPDLPILPVISRVLLQPYQTLVWYGYSNTMWFQMTPTHPATVNILVTV